MNCRNISEMIYKYSDGQVSPQEYADMSQHLAECKVCQHMYQLTLIENDILREKDDIPELSPAFTSLVMNSLQVTGNMYNSGKLPRSKGRLWYSSLTALAAAIAVFLYLPHTNLINNQIFNYYQSANQETYSSPIASTQYDLYGSSDQVIVPDNSKADSPGTKLQIAQNTDKPVPTLDSADIQPMLLAGTESFAGSSLSSAPNVNRSNYSERSNSSAIILSDTVRPKNIPDRLKFVQVNNTDDKTVYNYASLDGKEYLQLTVTPYSDTKTELKSGKEPLPQEPFTLSRDMQIADKKVTVVFSGNISAEEMTKLADTVQFQDTATN